jgi:hypothetical protein
MAGGSASVPELVGDFFKKIFGRSKTITSRDLKAALIGVKRERRRKQMQLRKLVNKRGEMLDRIKKARKEGNTMEVDFLWEELKQLKVDAAYSRREAKILNLEGIGLTRYIRGLERLEKMKDEKRIQSLLERVRTSGLDEKLRGVEVDELAYMDALNATLEEVGLEVDELEQDEDPEKERFLAEIDAIVEAEDSGQIDMAIEKEEKLKKKLDEEKLEAEEAS